MRFFYAKLLWSFFALWFGFFSQSTAANNSNEIDLSKSRFYVSAELNNAELLYKPTISPRTFHLFAHGKSGELLIDGKWLNAPQIAKWFYQNNIVNQVDQLNIFGCEFAKGEKGMDAVTYLEQALNVKVHASDDITGIDGDWMLEIGGQDFTELYGSYNSNLQYGGSQDFDGDGLVNSADYDDDNDGIFDNMECGKMIPSPVCDGYEAFDFGDGIGMPNYPGPCWTHLQNTSGSTYSYHNAPGQLQDPPKTSIAYFTESPACGSFGALWAATTTSGPANNGSSKIGLHLTGLVPGATYRIALYQRFLGFAPSGPLRLEVCLDNNCGLTPTIASPTADWELVSVDLVAASSSVVLSLMGYYTTPAGIMTYMGLVGVDGVTVTQLDGFSATQTACDLDGDGIMNSFDRDTDNDGCFDALEGGNDYTSSNLTGLGSLSGATVTNGYIGVPTASCAVGQQIGNSQNALQVDESCPCNTQPLCTVDCDTDGDGMINKTDLDDDNDGILDNVECPGLVISPTCSTTNLPTFSLGTTGDTGMSALDYIAPPCWTAPSGMSGTSTALAGWLYGKNSPFPPATASPDGGAFAIFSSPNVGMQTNVGPLVPGATYEVCFYQKLGGYTFTPINSLHSVKACFGISSCALSEPMAWENDIVGQSTWEHVCVELVAPSAYTTLVLSTTAQVAGYTNDILSMVFVDGISMTQVTDENGDTPICDEDGDGIENSCDTDSDNDGCYDAIEGGAGITANQVTSTGQISGSVGATGIPFAAGTGQGIADAYNASASSQCPPPSCTLAIISASAATACNPATNTYTLSVTVATTNIPSGAAIFINGISFLSNGAASQTFVLPTAYTANGQSMTITASSSTCADSNGYSFTAPASCAGCTLNITSASAATACDPATGTYTIQATVAYTNIPNGTPIMINGQAFTSNGSGNQTFTLATPYLADGMSEFVIASSGSCVDPDGFSFTAPTNCTAPSCTLAITSAGPTAAGCNSTNNTYLMQVTVNTTGIPSGSTIFINAESFTTNGNASQTFVLNAPYTADGLSEYVTAFSLNCIDPDGFTFTAPAPCSTNSCTINVSSAGPTSAGCNPTTNKYTMQVTVSYTNIASGSTITINGQNFTSNGSGNQTFTLTTPYESDGLSESVTVSSSGCTAPAYSFTAPAPCNGGTTNPCQNPSCTPVPTYTICNDGSNGQLLTVPTTYTNVIWHNSSGTQIGTGYSLTVNSNTNGMADGSECFYPTSNSGGCPANGCCPIIITSQSCCNPGVCIPIQITPMN